MIALPAAIAVPPAISNGRGSVPVKGSEPPSVWGATDVGSVGAFGRWLAPGCGGFGGGVPAASARNAIVRMLGADHTTAAPSAAVPPRRNSIRRVMSPVGSVTMDPPPGPTQCDWCRPVRVIARDLYPHCSIVPHRRQHSRW